jgi:hypothetical protein
MVSFDAEGDVPDCVHVGKVEAKRKIGRMGGRA